MTDKHPFSEEAVSWNVDEIEVHATLPPRGKVLFPAVIFISRQRPDGPELEYSPDPGNEWQRSITCPCAYRKWLYHRAV